MDDIDRLLNFVADEIILQMTDEEILQMAKDQGIDLDAEQARFQAMVEKAIERAKNQC